MELFPMPKHAMPTCTTRQQASRHNRAAITFFVRPEMKIEILKMLINRGYGTGFQSGLSTLLRDLIEDEKA